MQEPHFEEKRGRGPHKKKKCLRGPQTEPKSALNYNFKYGLQDFDAEAGHVFETPYLEEVDLSVSVLKA